MCYTEVLKPRPKRCGAKFRDDVSPLHGAIGDPEIPLFHTLMVWIFWEADREVQAGINEKEKDLLSCASFGWSLLGVNDRN